jgi:hypothetical protein
MKPIRNIFSISSSGNSIVQNHSEYPSKEKFIEYAKSLDDWGGIFISFTDGEIQSLREVLLNMID